MKTSTKRKAISKVKSLEGPDTYTNKRVSKKSLQVEKINKVNKEIHDMVYKQYADKWDDIEVPDMTQWSKGFDDGTVCGYDSASNDMSLVNKITWVLTLVNVAILISLLA